MFAQLHDAQAVCKFFGSSRKPQRLYSGWMWSTFHRRGQRGGTEKFDCSPVVTVVSSTYDCFQDIKSLRDDAFRNVEDRMPDEFVRMDTSANQAYDKAKELRGRQATGTCAVSSRNATCDPAGAALITMVEGTEELRKVNEALAVLYVWRP
jgi:hypothetical protein